MATHLLDLAAGEIVDVQLSSETVVSRSGRGAEGGRVVSSQIRNTMRLRLRRDGGDEQEFSFVNSTIGVAVGHRIGIALAKGGGLRRPTPVALHNFSTGQHEEIVFAMGLAGAAELIGTRWRAVLATALLMLLCFAGLKTFSGPHPLLFTLAIGVCAYFLFWIGFAVFDAHFLPACAAARSSACARKSKRVWRSFPETAVSRRFPAPPIRRGRSPPPARPCRRR